MADTTKEILTLEEGTSCRLIGKVKVVFDMASGQSKHGTWYRQDFILQDSEGEVKVGWFNPGPEEKMTILQGAQVQVQGEVNHWTDTKVHPPERKTSVKASGSSAVKAVDGGDLSQPPGATNAPAPAQGTSQGQKTAQNASGAVQRQGSSALPLAEYQRWWLGRWEWYENSPPIQRAIARGEAVARAIRDAIGAEWMSQPPNERDIERSPYGGAPAPPRGGSSGPDEEERAAYRSGPQPGDDDEEIPF